MDELNELMDHHTEQARMGVTFCTRIMTAQFNGLAANALLNIAKCDA